MTPAEYVDAVRLKTSTGSDYAIAKLLGVSQQSVYAWRDNEGAMDNFACMRVAELLDMPLERVIADMEVFREKNPERRAAWKGLLGKWAACLVVATVTTIGVSNDTSASGQNPISDSGKILPRINYTQRARRLMGRWMAGSQRVFNALHAAASRLISTGKATYA
jgi:hypothetical protein